MDLRIFATELPIGDVFADKDLTSSGETVQCYCLNLNKVLYQGDGDRIGLL